jgi:TolA protein
MSTGKLFIIVFIAVLLGNAATLLALYGVQAFAPGAAVSALPGVTSDASSATAPSGEVAEKWVPAIQKRIQQFWIHPPGSWDGYSTVVNVQLEPGGRVAPGKVSVVTGSGNAAFDQSVVAAIYDASPLPVPDGRAFAPFRDFDLVLRP